MFYQRLTFVLYDIIYYDMAIPEKSINECSTVLVEICGEAKRLVVEKRNELKEKGYPKPGKAQAIIKLILGK